MTYKAEIECTNAKARLLLKNGEEIETYCHVKAQGEIDRWLEPSPVEGYYGTPMVEVVDLWDIEFICSFDYGEEEIEKVIEVTSAEWDINDGSYEVFEE